MNKKLLGIVGFSLCLAINQAAFAHCGCGEGIKKIVDGIKLDETQKSKIKPVFENLFSTIKQDAPQLHDLNKKINEEVRSDNMDENTVNGFIDQKTKLIGDIIKAKVKAKHDILVILKPAQKEQLKDNLKKIESKIEDKMKQCHASH